MNPVRAGNIFPDMRGRIQYRLTRLILQSLLNKKRRMMLPVMIHRRYRIRSIADRGIIVITRHPDIPSDLPAALHQICDPAQCKTVVLIKKSTQTRIHATRFLRRGIPLPESEVRVIAPALFITDAATGMTAQEFFLR